ncbi:MAG: MlaA family lipoprotein [Verrucomicrobiota bacterium]|jgi:phospholipid-binding lipoprotein MlaA
MTKKRFYSNGPGLKHFLSGFCIFALAFFFTMNPANLAQARAPEGHAEKLQPGQMPYFDVVPDPIEGFNRCSWAFNDCLFRGVIYPASIGYNFVAPKAVRTKISNVGHNLSYPVRFFNSCFQGKWHGAWEETKRFGANSTVGLGGFFDPATHWKIGRSDEDFGQTLGYYGCGPGFYLVIPVLGPCNGRDALGKIVDWPMDISSDLTLAYPDKVWAMTIRPGITVNDVSGEARDYKRQLDSLVDPYQAFRTLYSLNRQRLITDYRPTSDSDSKPNPTLGAVLFKPVIPDFADTAVTRKVRVPATGKKLAYSCWMQKKPAPLVCYIPGLGAYRLDRSTVAYADLMYRHGYSVVAFSNPFQKEFMESASTMAVPGYAPADCDDVVNALKLILADMRQLKGDNITGTCLTGVSHGGYFTLMIAGREAAGKLGGLTFDRYVAVNPPPQLARAAQCLDQMFNAPLAWPAAERWKRMEDALYKALHFADDGLDISGNIPLTRAESDFVLGVAFRYTLMNVIVDSQRRENLGVLKVKPGRFVRQDSIREIRRINYGEYTDRFVLPYLTKSGRVRNRQDLIAATDLGQSAEFLRYNPKIRVQICEDDFLLTPADVAWFRSTFGTNLTVYPVGGHLGNLHIPAVQETLVRLFSDNAAN